MGTNHNDPDPKQYYLIDSNENRPNKTFQIRSLLRLKGKPRNYSMDKISLIIESVSMVIELPWDTKYVHYQSQRIHLNWLHKFNARKPTF